MSTMSLASASNWAWVLVITAVARRGRLDRSWDSKRNLFIAATKGTISSCGQNQYNRMRGCRVPDRVEGIHSIGHRSQRDGVQCQFCVVPGGVDYVFRAKPVGCTLSSVAMRSRSKQLAPFPFVHELGNYIFHSRKHVPNGCSAEHRHE